MVIKSVHRPLQSIEDRLVANSDRALELWTRNAEKLENWLADKQIDRTDQRIY